MSCDNLTRWHLSCDSDSWKLALTFQQPSLVLRRVPVHRHRDQLTSRRISQIVESDSDLSFIKNLRLNSIVSDQWELSPVSQTRVDREVTGYRRCHHGLVLPFRATRRALFPRMALDSPDCKCYPRMIATLVGGKSRAEGCTARGSEESGVRPDYQHSDITTYNVDIII